MNFKDKIEKETGFKIKKNRYLKPPALPYYLYQNKITKRGSDTTLLIQENKILIERYSESNNSEDLKDIEKINKFLKDNDYDYDEVTEWLDEEGLYGTFWDLDPILEKIREERK